MRTIIECILVGVSIVGFYLGPSVLGHSEAESFVKFADGGVSVSVVRNSAMSGSGDPIGIPGGVSLMMGAQYEFTNTKGETRRLELCNGHPDYSMVVLAQANEDRPGYKLRFELSKVELQDLHTKNSWWMRHMGFERRLRVVKL